MQKSKLVILLFLITSYCISCNSYSTIEEESIKLINGSIFEEQKLIHNEIVFIKGKVKEEVSDNGSKPFDLDVETKLISICGQTDKIIDILDTLLQRKKISKNEIRLLGDSIKSLMNTNSFRKVDTIFVKELEEFIPELKKGDHLDADKGKLNILALRNKLILWEMKIAEELASEVGSSSSCGYQRIFPIVEAESETVEEGGLYVAKLFWAAPTYLRGQAKINDIELKENMTTGTYNFSFKTTADKFDENGICKKKWNLFYTYRNFKTRSDTTIIVTRDYYVKKPCK